jgi:protein-disulfide isomerase
MTSTPSRPTNFKGVLDSAASVAFIVVAAVFAWKMLATGPARSTASARPVVPMPTAPLGLPAGSTLGSEHANAGLLIFSDFECPFCGQFARESLSAFKEKYVARGEVLLAFSHFPLEQVHKQALFAAQLTECAGRQGKFWEMHDRLFRAPGRLSSSSLDRWAASIGIAAPDLRECLNAPEIEDRIDAQVALARSLQVVSTPTLMFGHVEAGKMLRVSEVLVGYQSLQALEEALARVPRRVSASGSRP